MQIKVNETQEEDIAGWSKARLSPKGDGVREHHSQSGNNETTTAQEPGKHYVEGKESGRGVGWDRNQGACTFKKHRGKRVTRAGWYKCQVNYPQELGVAASEQELLFFHNNVLAVILLSQSMCMY